MSAYTSALTRACGFALLCVAAAPVGAAVFGLKPPTLYETGSTPDSVGIGDVTGDGRPDVIMVTGNDFSDADHHLFIFAQNNQGALSPPTSLPLLATGWGSSANGAYRLQVADLNRDGTKDVIVGHDQGLTVFTALSGRFSSKAINFASAIAGLGAVDIDRDGDIDLVRQGTDGMVAILLNTGNGDFKLARTFLASYGWRQALRIGDVTGDGRVDLVMTNQISLSVYPGRGDGSFLAARITPYPDTDDPRGFGSVAIADIDHDGRNDVVSTTPGNVPSAKLWLFKQTTNGTLAQPATTQTRDLPEALMATDLDNNGYVDIAYMTQEAYAGNVLSYRLQDRAGLSYEHWFGGAPAASHIRSDGLALGDVNGDGCTDAAVANGLGFVAIKYGFNCLEPAAMVNHHDGDFDGDGKGDILWHNTATGASVIWRSGNSTAQIPVTRVTNIHWVISGVGDFDGDGKSDILWHNDITGDNAVWPSASYLAGVSLTRVRDLNWQIAGIGDFDGNGRDDIFWRHLYSGRNAVWPGGSYSDGWSPSAVTDKDWRVAGVGDFNADGRADVLWRHAYDGRNTIWRNADIRSGLAVTAVVDVAWQVAGLGDFDGDRRTDILWRHSIDGRNVIWSAGNSAASKQVLQVSNLSWKIAGVADYAGDGRSDVLWRNNRSGANVIWRDANSGTPQPVQSNVEMNWKIAR